MQIDIEILIDQGVMMNFIQILMVFNNDSHWIGEN